MALTKESNDSVKNYITPSGLQRLRDELRFLLARERPAVTQVVAWAASNGDRSENADYQYNKRRLRQIDGRIRFLRKRIDAAEVVDPETPRSGRAAKQVFFGATVLYTDTAGSERLVRIVGLDEIDLDRNHISWRSPLACRGRSDRQADTLGVNAEEVRCEYWTANSFWCGFCSVSPISFITNRSHEPCSNACEGRGSRERPFCMALPASAPAA
jgi:transcription elongation factor GreB